MKKFVCKTCGSDRLWLTKVETLSLEVAYDTDDTERYKDFDCTGKEEVVDCEYDGLFCQQGHRLTLDGIDDDGQPFVEREVLDWEDFIEWLERYGVDRL